MTEAESKEIVDSIKAIIEKATATPIPSSPPSIRTTILENPKEIMNRLNVRQRILIRFQSAQHLVGCQIGSK